MIIPPTTFYRYSFLVQTRKKTTIHPPFIYNAIKTARLECVDDSGEPGGGNRMVLDASWSTYPADEHSFSVTLDERRDRVWDLVDRSLEYWLRFFETKGRLVEYGIQESRIPVKIPRNVSHILVATRSPLCASLVDGGHRRYLRPSDLQDFRNLIIHAIRKYRDLFGELRQSTYDRIVDFTDEVCCIANDVRYFPSFPLRTDGSLRVTKSVIGSVLYGTDKWLPEVLHLLSLAEAAHLGQKTAYGLGGVSMTLLSKAKGGQD